MPHAVHCGKPRAAGGCHAIALRFGHFSAKRNGQLTDAGALAYWKP